MLKSPKMWVDDKLKDISQQFIEKKRCIDMNVYVAKKISQVTT